MAKWVSSAVLDGGLNAIKNGALKQILVSTYGVGDSYATVIANRLAEVAMASTDFTLASSGLSRTLTTAAGKSATSTASSVGTDLHIAFTDGTANVLWVTDETTNAAFTSPQTINFPSVVYTSPQPV